MEADTACQSKTPFTYAEVSHSTPSAFQSTTLSDSVQSLQDSHKEKTSGEHTGEPKHSIPPIELADLEAMFEGSQHSESQFSSLFRDHIADVDEPIWINFLTCAYHALIPKKQAAWVIKQVGDIVRDNFDPNVELNDYHRIQRRSILIGYTLLAILELKNSREDDIFTENEKYFAVLTEKSLVKESIKIGHYIQRMIQKSEKDIHEADLQYQVGSLFAKFFDSISGDRSGPRRKMLIDWTSMERMKHFQETISTLNEEAQQPEQELSYHLNPCNKKEDQHQTLKFEGNYQSYVKETIIIEPPPEHQATSCNESCPSQSADIDNFQFVPEKIEKSSQNHLPILEQPQQQIPNQREQVLVNQQTDLPESEGLEPLNLLIRNEEPQPEPEVLCSTTDTSNFISQPANIDHLPQIRMVMEQEEENKEIAGEIKDTEDAQVDKSENIIEKADVSEIVNFEPQQNVSPQICVSGDMNHILPSNKTEVIEERTSEQKNEAEENIDYIQPKCSEIEQKPTPEDDSIVVTSTNEEKNVVPVENEDIKE